MECGNELIESDDDVVAKGKHVPKRVVGTERIYYRFKMKCKNGDFGDASTAPFVMTPGDTWDHVRYLIEYDLGYHRGGKQDTTVAAYRREDFERFGGRIKECTMLNHTDHLFPDDCLVLVRKPLPPGQPPYVPVKFQRATFASDRGAEEEQKIEAVKRDIEAREKREWQELDEEERLLAIAGAVDEETERKKQELERMREERDRAFRIHGPRMHPETYAVWRKTHAPPEHYMCHRCRGKGHWKEDCPTLNDALFKPLGKVRTAHGIPKKWMKPVDDPDDIRHAHQTQTGEMYVVQRPVKEDALKNDARHSPYRKRNRRRHRHHK